MILFNCPVCKDEKPAAVETSLEETDQGRQMVVAITCRGCENSFGRAIPVDSLENLGRIDWTFYGLTGQPTGG